MKGCLAFVTVLLVAGGVSPYSSPIRHPLHPVHPQWLSLDECWMGDRHLPLFSLNVWTQAKILCMIMHDQFCVWAVMQLNNCKCVFTNFVLVYTNSVHWNIQIIHSLSCFTEILRQLELKTIHNRRSLIWSRAILLNGCLVENVFVCSKRWRYVKKVNSSGQHIGQCKVSPLEV